MNEIEIQNTFIEILRTVINDTESSSELLQKITDENLDSLYRLAKKHQLAHFVSNYVYRNRITDISEELLKSLQRNEILSVYKSEQMKYTFEQVCNIFDETNITYVPLKGSVIRPYYPYEGMRTSCDIDILIREENLDTAISCLKTRGYTCGDRHYHDVSIFSPNKIHIELHFNIQENIDSLDNVLKKAWDYSEVEKNSRYRFKKEFFVFHMYAHMAYHFLSGGCGIRSLLDIWVMENKMNASYKLAKHLLEQAGIYKFASEMSNIANICFGDRKMDSFSQLVLNYIFSGGVFGTASNQIAVEKSSDSRSFVYFWKRLFLSYNGMVVLYPFLKRLPFLLPFCWVDRWIKAIFGGKYGRIKREINCVNNLSESKIEEIKLIRSRMKI